MADALNAAVIFLCIFFAFLAGKAWNYWFFSTKIKNFSKFSGFSS